MGVGRGSIDVCTTRTPPWDEVQGDERSIVASQRTGMEHGVQTSASHVIYGKVDLETFTLELYAPHVELLYPSVLLS